MQRLITRSQFQTVLAGGTVARTTHFALHQAKPDQPVTDQNLAIGVMVPKRWAKRAVTRNNIKRQVYSVCVDFESVLPTLAHVVRLRSSFDRSRFISATSDLFKTAVRSELQQLFANATLRSSELKNGVK